MGAQPPVSPRHWTREPLLHFLVFGLFVFGVECMFSEPRGRQGDDVIVVSQALLNDLEGQLEQQLERELVTERELGEAVDAWIMSEVLVREAHKRGLSTDDPIVRAHLVRKMRHVVDAREVAPVPTEEELKALYRQHASDYHLKTQLTLRQLYVSTKEDADALLARAQQGEPLKTLSADAELPPGGPVLRGRELAALAAGYGEGFVVGLETQPLGEWVVRRSTAGWHVVRVEKRRPGRQLDFEEARNRLLLRWQRAQVKLLSADALQSMRDAYTVQGWPR